MIHFQPSRVPTAAPTRKVPMRTTSELPIRSAPKSHMTIETAIRPADDADASDTVEREMRWLLRWGFKHRRNAS